VLSARLFWQPGLYGMPWPPFRVLFERALVLETEMPKLKTKSGVKKRFKVTATGKVMAGAAGKRHRLEHHSGKYIRQNRGTSELAKPDADRVKLWMPYGLK